MWGWRRREICQLEFFFGLFCLPLALKIWSQRFIGKRHKCATKKWSPWSWVHSLLNYRNQIKIVRKHFITGVFTVIATILARIGNLSTNNRRFWAFIISSQEVPRVKIRQKYSERRRAGMATWKHSQRLKFHWNGHTAWISSTDSANKGRIK